MVRELKNRIFFAIILVTILLVITGCGSTSGVNNVNTKKYYTGYNSIEMRFLTDSPPTIFYYDSEAGYASAVNTIPIHVEIYNRGSSDTFGALFVHGFDPNIVAVQGYSSASSTVFPGYTGGSRGTSAFNGWFDTNGNFIVNALRVSLGGNSNQYTSLSLGSIGGRGIMSFSIFGNTRADMFQRLNYGTSSQVLSGNIGSILNPITRGMFDTYGWSGWLKNFLLEGRNSNNPGGGMDVIEFPARILTLPASLEEFRQRVMVTACFDYATHASTMVCLDAEPYSNVKKACRPQTVSVGGGQGAPVAITTIEQRPGKGRTTFVINIHHTKKESYDELYDYFNLYKCDPASGEMVKTTDKNIVYVGYVYLSDWDITMNCIPDQIIRLDESGNGQITCSVEFPKGSDGKPLTSSAYESPMEIELWYGYSKTIYKDVIVRRI